MKAPIFIRALTADEQQQIQAELRSSSAFVLRRCQISLASARREHASMIAKTPGCDDQTVRDVIKGINEKGLVVLGKQSCLPHRLRTSVPDETFPQLRDLFHRSPREFGLSRSLWSLPLAAKLCFSQGLVVAPITGASVRRALKRLGVNWKHANDFLTSPDPMYRQKKRGVPV
jgi:hypothetical protein